MHPSIGIPFSRIHSRRRERIINFIFRFDCANDDRRELAEETRCFVHLWGDSFERMFEKRIERNYNVIGNFNERKERSWLIRLAEIRIDHESLTSGGRIFPCFRKRREHAAERINILFPWAEVNRATQPRQKHSANHRFPV